MILFIGRDVPVRREGSCLFPHQQPSLSRKDPVPAAFFLIAEGLSVRIRDKTSDILSVPYMNTFIGDMSTVIVESDNVIFVVFAR